MIRSGRRIASVLAIAACAGCGNNSEGPPSPASVLASAQPAPSASASAAAAAHSADAGASAPPPTNEGGSIVRSARADALYVADDLHAAIRIVPLPVADDLKSAPSVALPGRPGQVLATRDRVLVAIRDPGLLLVLRPDAEHGLVETGRVVVPGDAWGLAVSPDGATAVVTSAWTHKVTIVDVGAGKVRATHDVAREPRAVVVRPDGAGAYVSHLVGSALTRVPLGEGSPERLELPPAPLRTPLDTRLEGSLGWALALGPDGRRLFAARHALGAVFSGAWFGAATIDALQLANDKPVIAERKGKPLMHAPLFEVADPFLQVDPVLLTQPRALLVRHKTKTLLVASEGQHVLVELDASTVDPSARALATWKLGRTPDPTEPAPTLCVGPTGVALSADEETAFVYCASSGDIAVVDLSIVDPRVTVAIGRAVHLVDDPLPKVGARGRRVFHDASDTVTSGGLACAGCHPEGRDDGHLWMEIYGEEARAQIFVAGKTLGTGGLARQTPMLAGRVAGEGPYGWHAQNDTLAARVREGVRLHRWFNPSRAWQELDEAVDQRAEALAAFLRNGLVPPQRDAHAATPEEARGKAVFLSQETACSGCHVPTTGFTNGVAVPLPQPMPPEGFLTDPNNAFKTPSLLFVGGTAPYFHDGSAATLEELVSKNDDRMGKTRQLSEADRAALVAYLKTL